MRMERIQGWISLLANVAVLAGIVFLGIEIRQNTEAVVAASSTALTDQSVDFFSAGLDNQVVARALFKQTAGEELDPFEAAQLGRLQYLNFRVFENAYLQYRRGFYEAAEWERYQRIIRRIFASDPVAVTMWERNRGSGFTELFEREVERLIDDEGGGVHKGANGR